jgi:hypothetical protein
MGACPAAAACSVRSALHREPQLQDSQAAPFWGDLEGNRCPLRGERHHGTQVGCCLDNDAAAKTLKKTGRTPSSILPLMQSSAVRRYLGNGGIAPIGGQAAEKYRTESVQYFAAYGGAGG